VNCIEVATFTAQIYVGLKVGYGIYEHPAVEAHRICQTYCDKVKLCVTVTPTAFHYVDGNEEGVIVGLINYPRFPSTPEKITEQAVELAKLLKEGLNQNRVSIVTPTKTIMLGEP